jgi:hypothetical protein
MTLYNQLNKYLLIYLEQKSPTELISHDMLYGLEYLFRPKSDICSLYFECKINMWYVIVEYRKKNVMHTIYVTMNTLFDYILVKFHCEIL